MTAKLASQAAGSSATIESPPAAPSSGSAVLPEPDCAIQSAVDSLDTAADPSRAASPHHVCPAWDEQDSARLRADILEIRRLTGFSWSLMAWLLRSTKHCVNEWIRGKPAREADLLHLEKTLATLRKIDRGDADLNHELLLTLGGPRGQYLVDLFYFKQYEKVVSIAGTEGPAVWSRPTYPGGFPPRPPVWASSGSSATIESPPATPGSGSTVLPEPDRAIQSAVDSLDTAADPSQAASPQPICPTWDEQDSARLRADIFEIRRLTGFSWSLMALLLRSTKHCVNEWIRGKPAREADLLHLEKTLATLRKIDRGDVELNHELLLTPGGYRDQYLLDLFYFRQYERVVSIAGTEGPAVWPEPTYGGFPVPPPVWVSISMSDDRTGVVDGVPRPDKSFPVPKMKF